MKKYKVVIDTNLLIAGNFNPRSASLKILQWAAKAKLVHVWTEDIKKEHTFILSKIPKKKGYLDFIKQIYKQENLIKNPPKVELSEDPDDDKYLACAQKAQADYIISSDDHLLKIKKFGKTEILTPSAFVKRASNKSKSTKFRTPSSFRKRI